MGDRIIRQELIKVFVNVLKDDEAEVRTAAASQVPGTIFFNFNGLFNIFAGFSLLIDEASVLKEILPCVKELVIDTSQHVRASIATQISGLAPIFGKDK